MSRKKGKEAQGKPAGMSKYALKLQWRRANTGGAPIPLVEGAEYRARTVAPVVENKGK
jgi:hypothetical protein